MRNIQLVLFTAIVVLGLVISARAATITVGNFDLLPNTPGQAIRLYVTGIIPNAGGPPTAGNVNGILLSVTIANGGVAWGGVAGPAVTDFDVDSGPSIWVAPNSPGGHNPEFEYFEGQLAQVNFL